MWVLIQQSGVPLSSGVLHHGVSAADGEPGLSRTGWPGVVSPISARIRGKKSSGLMTVSAGASGSIPFRPAIPACCAGRLVEEFLVETGLLV